MYYSSPENSHAERAFDPQTASDGPRGASHRPVRSAVWTGRIKSSSQPPSQSRPHHSRARNRNHEQGDTDSHTECRGTYCITYNPQPCRAYTSTFNFPPFLARTRNFVQARAMTRAMTRASARARPRLSSKDLEPRNSPPRRRLFSSRNRSSTLGLLPLPFTLPSNPYSTAVLHHQSTHTSRPL